jgi:RNA polymerase sigma factor (sigma-70 family)
MHDLYPRLLRQVSAACRKRGLYRAADTEDVLQDVCEVILTKWGTFHVERSLWAWIGTIIVNKVMDVHRRGSRLSSIDQLQQAEDGPPIFIGPAMTHDPAHEDCVARVLSQLMSEGPARAGSIRTIELINFIVDCGTDTEALAEFLGCSESAAKERKRYALEKIRELCARFCESPECAATLSG